MTAGAPSPAWNDRTRPPGAGRRTGRTRRTDRPRVPGITGRTGTGKSGTTGDARTPAGAIPDALRRTDAGTGLRTDLRSDTAAGAAATPGAVLLLVAAMALAGCSPDGPTTPTTPTAPTARPVTRPTAPTPPAGFGEPFSWSVEMHRGGGDFYWVATDREVPSGGTGVHALSRGFWHGNLQQPVVRFRAEYGAAGAVSLSVASRTAPAYRPRDTTFGDSFGDGEAYVWVGGYGDLTLEARHLASGATSRFRVEIGDLRDNAREVETIRFGGDHTLAAIPRIRRIPATCDPRLRRSAIRFTEGIWEDWRLPIPVDLVDNFPAVREAWIWTNGEPTGYLEAFDPSLMREQIEAYAEQIEENLGFPIIEFGRLISAETLAQEGGAARPRRTQRFHVGYQVGDCPLGAAACAHIESGFASWWVRASVGDFGEAVAMAHEIEHLLGFKHEYSELDESSRRPDGVAMDEPAYINFLPGQRYWTGNHEWQCGRTGRNSVASTDSCYKEWDDSRYTASATLENLYCIFESQRR